MTKAQLEALIQREAEEHEKYAWRIHPHREITNNNSFTAGASLLLPALIEALTALNHPDIKYLDCECGYFEGNNSETIYHFCAKCKVVEALQRIKELLGEKQ